MAVDEKKMAKEMCNKYTQAVRVHKRVYAELTKLRLLYCEQQELTNVSFSKFLLELCRVGEMLLTGNEVYESNGKLFTDMESARGEAILVSSKLKQPAKPPVIMLIVGEDELLK